MTVTRYPQAAARLRGWLLEGPAQLRTGEHAGGVAGSFDAQGRAGYVYGEITGYYLHWLADLGRARAKVAEDSTFTTVAVAPRPRTVRLAGRVVDETGAPVADADPETARYRVEVPLGGRSRLMVRLVATELP